MQKKSIAKTLTILSPSILLRAMGMDVIIACIPYIAHYFDASFTATQLILSVYFFGAGFGQLIFGPLSDKYGRRKILLISTTMICISSLLCAQAPDILALILLRFVQGLGACGTTVVCMAIVRDIYDDQTLPKVYSYLNGIIALAPLLAPLLGGMLLIATNSWRSTFYFMVIFSAIALLLNYFFVAETNPYRDRRAHFNTIDILKNYKKVLLDWHFWSYCWCGLAGMCSLFLFFSMSSILFIEHLKISIDAFGYLFALDSAMFLLANMLSPILQKRIGIHKTILVGSVLIVIGACGMLISESYYGLEAYSLLSTNIIATFGIGLLFGPCMAGVVKNYKHIAGIASALYGAILWGGSGIIVALIMLLKINNTKPLAVPMLVLGLINVLVMWRTLPHSKREAIQHHDYQ